MSGSSDASVEGAKALVNTSRPQLGDAEALAVGRVMASGYLGMGPETRNFEAALAAYLGSQRVAVCVSSGTNALHLAVASLNPQPGDEVLVPSMTFLASFQAIVGGGCRPRLCDVEPDTGLIDLVHARKRMRSSVKAIMPVHFAGNPGDLEAVYEFADEYGLRVIEDAAHAFGSAYRGKLIGSFGDLVCFSFDPIKNITCGEGGAIITGSSAAAERLAVMRSLGLEAEAHFEDGAPDVIGPGWRFHMSDMMAAVGNVQLARFESELKPARLALADHYLECLRSAPQLTPMVTTNGVVPHIMAVRVHRGRRATLRRQLAAAGFETRIHYRPGHHFSAFADREAFPGADQLFNEIVSLPLHAGVSVNNIEAISAICHAL